jgi:hypothetical protein
MRSSRKWVQAKECHEELDEVGGCGGGGIGGGAGDGVVDDTVKGDFEDTSEAGGEGDACECVEVDKGYEAGCEEYEPAAGVGEVGEECSCEECEDKRQEQAGDDDQDTGAADNAARRAGEAASAQIDAIEGHGKDAYAIIVDEEFGEEQIRDELRLP